MKISFIVDFKVVCASGASTLAHDHGEPRRLIKMLSLADLFGYFGIESQRFLCKVLN